MRRARTDIGPLPPLALVLAVLVVCALSAELVSSVEPLPQQSSREPEDNPFQVVPEAFVIGPTVFPKPTELPHLPADRRPTKNKKLVPFLKPILGQHRPDQDAVLVFASEYRLDNYALFIESLRSTGFKGDIVMAIHPLHDWEKKPQVRQYLESYAVTTFPNDGPHVVVYAPTPDCFNMERQHVDSSKGGSRTCVFHHLYGIHKNNDGEGSNNEEEDEDENGEIVPVSDPRPDRTVANIRYELYWIMAIHYHPHVWIMLVDARDTVFQSNPFAHVPRRQKEEEEEDNGNNAGSGELFFFGENRNATRIGLSKQNNRWIRAAYGDILGDALSNQPTICSGATLGEQVALETYLRAIVAEADETGVVLVGSDQGFHNRLYYSSKLANSPTIRRITVFDQGTGIVNNMGAMRTKPLEEWGNGRIVEKNGADYTVLNWDGTPSPVVHQFDRHKELSEYFFKQKTRDYLAEWRARQSRPQ